MYKFNKKRKTFLNKIHNWNNFHLNKCLWISLIYPHTIRNLIFKFFFLFRRKLHIVWFCWNQNFCYIPFIETRRPYGQTMIIFFLSEFFHNFFFVLCLFLFRLNCVLFTLKIWITMDNSKFSFSHEFVRICIICCTHYGSANFCFFHSARCVYVINFFFFFFYNGLNSIYPFMWIG